MPKPRYTTVRIKSETELFRHIEWLLKNDPPGRAFARHYGNVNAGFHIKQAIDNGIAIIVTTGAGHMTVVSTERGRNLNLLFAPPAGTA